MTPTIRGRIQTRIVLVGTVGMLWTLLISPFLPRPSGASLSMVYHITTQGIGVVAVVGVAWELVYHALQQLRWDKDWPSLLGLGTMVNEGASTWVVLHVIRSIPGEYGASSPILSLFIIHFVSTWLIVWLVLQGPLRVIAPRWRWEGGRFL